MRLAPLNLVAFRGSALRAAPARQMFQTDVRDLREADVGDFSCDNSAM